MPRGPHSKYAPLLHPFARTTLVPQAHLRGVIVANLGVESRDEHEGRRHDFLNSISVKDECACVCVWQPRGQVAVQTGRTHAYTQTLFK